MSKKLPRGTLDRLWSDPAHWRGLGRYYCEDDPRIIVPKRIRGFGWTINFANSWAWPTVVFLVVSPASLIFLKVGHAPIAALVVFVLLWTIALFVICAVMSSTGRHEE
jgi:hypothetical protein